MSRGGFRFQNSDVRLFRPVIRAAEDGVFVLPAATQTLLAWRLRLEQRVAELHRPSSERVHTTLLVDVRTAVESEGPLPDGAAVVDAQQAETAFDALRRALMLVADDLEREIADSLSDADEMIIDHLRPAFEETVAEARELVGALGGVDLDPLALLHASDRQSKAGVAFRVVAERYSRLRDVQSFYAQRDPTFHDDGERFEMRNLRELAPDARVLVPFPSEPANRLRYLVDHGADLWMPTSAERDDLFQAQHPDKVGGGRRRKVLSLA